MITAEDNLNNTGLEVTDLRDDAEFLARSFHSHNITTQAEALRQLARAFVESPDTFLQQLVASAVQLCGADSAGISIVKDGGTPEQYYEWIAINGAYEGFLNALLPQYPSACSVCLERGSPQHFRVGKRFFDILGVEADEVTDGILLPWQVDGTHGTIFIMCHTNRSAFDAEDVRIMESLADFAAISIRNQHQQQKLLQQASAAASAAMANGLAHQINNPLQGLTNTLFLMAQSQQFEPELAAQANHDLARLSETVRKLLEPPPAEQKTAAAQQRSN